MASYLCVTVRFCQPLFHGRGDGDEPEWPPSPLRLFQALVAAAAGRWNERRRLQGAVAALRWLEKLGPPEILAPEADPSPAKYRLYVPDNVGDRAAASWARGGEADLSNYRTEKDVRPLRLGGDCLHYVYEVDDGDPGLVEHRETLFAATRSMSHLGWGIDMVTANAEVITKDGASRLGGERWSPSGELAANRLRVAREGTLDDLMDRHAAFLQRIGAGGFVPVPPVSIYGHVGYRRATEMAERPVAAFELRRVDNAGFRAFDAPGRSRTVAGMMRNLASLAARRAGWSDETIASFVLGHGESRDALAHRPVGLRRFAFLPAPSIEARGPGRRHVAGDIRRVLVTALGGDCESEIAWARRALANHPLLAAGSGREVAILALARPNDRVLPRYTGPSDRWATVTPVVLPGHDSPGRSRRRASAGAPAAMVQRRDPARIGRRIDGLLRKAIRHAGFPDALARHAILEWRAPGFWPGTEIASRYGVPEYLEGFPRLHVRISWRDSAGRPVGVPGPICIGGGRYFGLGLFAASPD
jgi:CRISPR-associated protein Csb2